jgi:molybdopterin-guanine dinucleotide biosynthesis protein A
MLKNGERSVLTFIERADAKLMTGDEIATIDPNHLAFRNINTPEDYQRLELP